MMTATSSGRPSTVARSCVAAMAHRRRRMQVRNAYGHINAHCTLSLSLTHDVPFPSHIAGQARKWGEYECDLSPAMLGLFGAHLRSLPAADVPRILLWTGDSPPHDVWNQTTVGNINSTLFLTQTLMDILPSSVIVIPSIGNHEAWPCNNFAVPPYNLPLYSAVADAWQPWIGAKASALLRQTGYFAQTIGAGLKVSVFVSVAVFYMLEPRF